MTKLSISHPNTTQPAAQSCPVTEITGHKQIQGTCSQGIEFSGIDHTHVFSPFHGRDIATN